MKNIKKWDIYFAKLEGNGSVERGNRPVMVVSNDIGNELANTVCVIPLTSKVHKKPLPTHVYINDPILKKPSLALTEQIRVIDKTELSFKIGNLKNEELRNKVSVAQLYSLGMEDLVKNKLKSS